MLTLEDVQDDIYRGAAQQYVCNLVINLYQTPACEGLVTQVDVGQHLRLLEVAKTQDVLRVSSCKDDYPGWMSATYLMHLSPASTTYRAPVLSNEQIQSKIPQVIEFAQSAMAVPNEYLWGGASAPNYDCSGLVQAAFMAAGVPLPRDSYQQEDFTERVAEEDLQLGDLLFFGTPERTTHVALYVGEGRYIHSSGKDKGRNGIGVDSITELSHPVSQRYHELIRCFGRVVKSYQPMGS